MTVSVAKGKEGRLLGGRDGGRMSSRGSSAGTRRQEREDQRESSPRPPPATAGGGARGLETRKRQGNGLCPEPPEAASPAHRPPWLGGPRWTYCDNEPVLQAARSVSATAGTLTPPKILGRTRVPSAPPEKRCSGCPAPGPHPRVILWSHSAGDPNTPDWSPETPVPQSPGTAGPSLAVRRGALRLEASVL